MSGEAQQEGPYHDTICWIGQRKWELEDRLREAEKTAGELRVALHELRGVEDMVRAEAAKRTGDETFLPIPDKKP